MKANNGSGNNPSRNEWETPNELFHNLDRQYGFGFDCCANTKNAKCMCNSDCFETISQDDIEHYISWMNPPFSIAWKMFEHFFKVVEHGIAIYRCDNFETGIWQKIIFPNCDWVFIPNKRINYEGLGGEGARFPSALIGVGVDPPIYLEGACLKVNEKEMPWASSSYVNPPFKGPTAWVRKAIKEYEKGKKVVFVFPIDKWIHMFIEAGAEIRNLKDVRWCSTEDGKPGKGTGRWIACFVLDPKKLDQVQKEL